MNTDKIYAEKIASEYAPKEASKVIALKKLDRKAKMPAQIFAYTFGSISALVFGLGMCLAMKIFGTGTLYMVLGIIIGVIAMALMSINYPIYNKILNNSKKKYSHDIVTLAKQISEE